MKPFNEIVKSSSFAGEKVNFNAVLNKPILVYAWKISPSTVHQGEDRLMLQFAYKDTPDEMHIVFSGSKVLMKQIHEVETTGEHEFETVISKVKRYYQFF